MKVEEIIPILDGAFQVGFMEAVKTYEPARDVIRSTEVKNWLKMIHVNNKTFMALVDNGNIRSFRIGNAKNSPLYFSKKEIKKAIFSVNIAKLLTSQKM